jgi:glycosyltransferase involved in cell wall biosynthesis
MTKSDDKSIYINGRFLTQNRTGVQRYCRQVVAAIDLVLQQQDCPAPLRESSWFLVAPPGTICDLDLKHIQFKEIGKGGGHPWEQLHLWRHSRKGLLLSLGNSGPVLHRRQIVVIHDAAIFFAPEGFARRYRMLHSWLGRTLSRTASIATVSEFSRRELARALKISADKMLIAPNGADHAGKIHPDRGIVDRLKVTPGKYFLTLGLSTANKNIPLAIEAHRHLHRPETHLVIAGEGSARVAGSQTLRGDSGVVIAGRLSDEELVGLMRCAAAFVFPSRYEGFGIPPLEAMVQGCPVLASTAPAVVEVCGGAALHFDPDDAIGLAALMARMLDEPALAQDLRQRGVSRSAQYRWSEASAVIMRGIEALSLNGGPH